MCLTVNPGYQPPPDPAIRYKLMLIDPYTNGLVSLFVRTQRWIAGQWQAAKFEPASLQSFMATGEGWDRTHHSPSPDPRNHGFHVYLDEDACRIAARHRHVPDQAIVVKVEVRGFIAGGLEEHSSIPSETWKECRVLP